MPPIRLDLLHLKEIPNITSGLHLYLTTYEKVRTAKPRRNRFNFSLAYSIKIWKKGQKPNDMGLDVRSHNVFFLSEEPFFLHIFLLCSLRIARN